MLYLIQRAFVLGGICLIAPTLAWADDEPGAVLLPRKAAPMAISFSAKTDAIAIAQDDRLLRIYEFPSMKGIGTVVSGFNGEDVSFSPCGQFLITHGLPEEEGKLRIWDLYDTPPKKIATLSIRTHVIDRFSPFVMGERRFSNDGKYAFAFGPGLGFYAWEWRKTSKPIFARSFGFNEETGFHLERCRFITDETFLALSMKGEIEIHKFKKFDLEFVKRIHAESFGTGHHDLYTFVTPDCNTFVSYNRRDEAVEIHDITRPRSKLVDRLLHYRRQPNGAEKMRLHSVSTTPDRSVIIVCWESNDKEEPGEYVDFFPRTNRRRMEFGLNENQSHLRMESDSEKAAFFDIRQIYSPDGKWFGITRWQGSAPRIWRVETLGRDLLADKNVKKK